MADTMEVDATIIDADITPLSASEEWLAQIRERAELAAERFCPHPVKTEAEYKASKRERADANREIRSINQERKDMTSALESAIRKFKEGCKVATEPLDEIVEGYDRENDAYLAAWKTGRELELAHEYAEIAPDLVPLVPFQDIMERYGNEKGSVWTNRTTNIEAAKDMLAAAVEGIAEGEKSIEELADAEDVETLKARYFETLDLQATLTEARRQKEQRERVRQLEEARREREEAMQPPEPPQETAQPVQPVQQPVQVPAPPEPPHPVQVPYEKPAIIPGPPEQPHAWVIAIPSATRAQMQVVAELLRDCGIRFDKIYSGDIPLAHEKWCADCDNNKMGA